ncbi:MAG: hypothetical protein ABI622_09600 [Chloroflexota bacterium]
MPRRTLIPLGWFVLVLAGCNGAPAAASFAVTASPSASSTSTQRATPSAATNGAPSELEGTWQTNVGTADQPERVTLRLQATGYQIKRGAFSGTGAITVDGNTITFEHANQCETDTGGAYHWAIDGRTLTLTPSEPRDPCPRIEVLAGHPYERIDS